MNAGVVGGDAAVADGCTTNYTATDSYGDTCLWYDANTYGCGDYDTDDFVADELCCAC